MNLQSDTVSPHQFDIAVNSSTLALNKAAGAGAAVFQLYLAFSEARGDTPVKWQEPITDVVEDDFPARLNQYRRSPLASSERDINTYLHWQQGLNQAASNEHIRLWQAISPDPLSFYNDKKRLPPEVKHNCPYHTQLGLLAPRPDPVREADATLLADIIPSARSMTV
ncbi:VC2046/SO_2500 family protein [Alteromonas lipolytica]|uniref:Uncharacterized protein n=1 Tax=Alteromonas lipolytica TaxID=1856405 RepID=A0A1E8FGQ8_9ALTE|nr:VC2046/SO_2500 family protein [Alteromonas lipolytica]OFI35120.1 hypothetical protein BFC17_16370 [Alteromonas lipolytica]GGF56862.1 hypothetical protein GCM10011338_06410 [Alteromonas lipolytica]